MANMLIRIYVNFDEKMHDCFWGRWNGLWNKLQQLKNEEF